MPGSRRSLQNAGFLKCSSRDRFIHIRHSIDSLVRGMFTFGLIGPGYVHIHPSLVTHCYPLATNGIVAKSMVSNLDFSIPAFIEVLLRIQGLLDGFIDQRITHQDVVI